MTEPTRASSPAVALEIAVTSLAGAVVARDEGADRVELCSALELGGVTPSQGLVELVVATGLPVHALVRCRPGDFVFDADDTAVMLREVRTLVAAGVAGVVVGALRADGSLDEEAVRRSREAAGPDVELTVHRAVDRSHDPVASVAALAALGVDRVLTSGGASRAADGLASGALAAMVREAGGVQVMAGGGVRVGDVPALVAASVSAVHLSAGRAVGDPGGDGDLVSLGSAGGGDVRSVTDASLVRAVRRELDDAAARRG